MSPLPRDVRRAGVEAASNDKPEVLQPRNLRIAAAVAAAIALGTVVVPFVAPTIIP